MAAPCWPRVSPISRFTIRRKSWISKFNSVISSNFCNCFEHHVTLCLTESDRCFASYPRQYKPLDPNGPRGVRVHPIRVYVAPSEESEMSRIRVLIFIDDERPVLSPQRLKDVEPTLQIRHTRFIVSSKGECARNVMISPWLIAKLSKALQLQMG